MIIESVAAAGAILSTISTAINKLNEVGDGAAKAVELMQGFSDALVMHNVINGARPTLTHTPVEIQNLITAAWDQSPKLRPSAAQIACLLAKC